MLGAPGEAKSRLQVFLQCPRYECGSGYVGTYTHTENSIYHLQRVEPQSYKEVAFSEEIRGLSPLFCAIYNQAMAAQAASLDHLTGIGLRKALEFLIKDFAIHERPDDADTIKGVSLGACIHNYIDDARVKEVAERAVWIGNDETHYVRKWTDMDIEDLKVLIRLSINAIENVLITRNYLTIMADRR